MDDSVYLVCIITQEPNQSINHRNQQKVPLNMTNLKILIDMNIYVYSENQKTME